MLAELPGAQGFEVSKKEVVNSLDAGVKVVVMKYNIETQLRAVAYYVFDLNIVRDSYIRLF